MRCKFHTLNLQFARRNTPKLIELPDREPWNVNNLNVTAQDEILVFILDDDPQDREVAREALLACRTRNQVQTFSQGQDLLDALNSVQGEDEFPGLILLDLHLPTMHGLEVLKRIREQEKFRDVPIIVVSSSRDESEISEAFQLGCNSYIDKNDVDVDLTDCLDSLEQYWINKMEFKSGQGTSA